MAKKLAIDYETADKITVLNLKDYRDNLQTELDKWRANPKTENNPGGYWLHDEDVVNNIKVIDAISIVLKQYGG